MVSKKHGKIVGWENLLKEGDFIVQKATYMDGSKAINIYKTLSLWNKEHSKIVIPLSYDVLKCFIVNLADLYGKSEVERELGIKIGGKTNGK